MSRILSRTLEMPRDPNKGFCRTPVIRRTEYQDVASLRMCRTRTLSSPCFHSPPSAVLTLLFVLLPLLCIRFVRPPLPSSPTLPSLFLSFSLSLALCHPAELCLPKDYRILQGAYAILLVVYARDS